MGTRCNIVLKCGDHVEYMYRHYDGYPDSVLPELDKYAKAIRWYGDNRKATHPSQWVEHCFADTAKTLAFYTDLLVKHPAWDKYMTTSLKPTKSQAPYEPMQLDGKYEKTNGIHGDIDYQYTILFYEKSKRVSTYFYKQIVRDAVTA